MKKKPHRYNPIHRRAASIHPYLILGATAISPMSAAAITYEWPVITKVTTSVQSSRVRIYSLWWDVVKITDDDLKDGVTTGEAYTQKTGLTPSQYVSTAVRHRHRSANMEAPTGGPVAGEVKTTHSVPFTIHAASVAQSMRRVADVYHTGDYSEGECVGLMTSSIAGELHPSWDDLKASNWDGGAGGAGNCLVPPGQDEWCALTTPSVTFEYGTMTLANATGATQSTTVGVECTTGMKYTLRLRGENEISLSNGMLAELQVNGEPLNSTIDGAWGPNTVNITSTLRGTPDRVGVFMGQSVLFVSYP